MKSIEELLTHKEIRQFEPVGSRVTCKPPPMDTDIDYLILAHNDWDFEEILMLNGFICEGDYRGDDFTSLRRGKENVILTSKINFFDQFMVATKMAKKFNLLKKKDRIDLFNLVIDGAYPDYTN
jgi:hypothetical protein